MFELPTFQAFDLYHEIKTGLGELTEFDDRAIFCYFKVKLT
jgi:hypothetical protein